MTWSIFWTALQNVVFWFFLFYGLIFGAGNGFGNVPSWQTRWAFCFVFVVCLLVFARALRIL